MNGPSAVSIAVALRRLRVLADILEESGRRGEAAAARNIARLLWTDRRPRGPA